MMIGMSSAGLNRPELELPTYDEFEALAETLLRLRRQPDAWCRAPVSMPGKISVGIERLYADADYLSWPLISFSLIGVLWIKPREAKLAVRYREITHHPATENSSVNHDYVLRAEGVEMVEFRHSVRGCPAIIPPPRDAYDEREHIIQATNGARLLKSDLGENLELTAGDCGVLFDRMSEFIQF
jgi:hypothetical protein